MINQKTSATENTGCQANPPKQPRISAYRRLKKALVLLALVATGMTIYQIRGVLETTDTADTAQNELYMPIVDPVLEPDRPDLIGEAPVEE